VKIQLPDQKQEMPTYVKTNPATTDTNASTEIQKPVTESPTDAATTTNTVATNLKPIDTGMQTLKITPTVDSMDNNPSLQETALKTENPLVEAAKANSPTAQLQILPTLSEMKTGEKAKLAIVVRSASAFRSAVVGLKFDAKKVAVRAVSFGDVFGRELSQTPVTPFMNQNGKMFVSLFTSKDVSENSSGILAYVEIEALADGKPEISFDADVLSFLTSDGKNFQVKF
jgi:hypothetical protein